MSEPMDFRPKYDAKSYDWSKGINTLEGYESPVTLYVQQIAQEIAEQRDNEIVAKITEATGINIDKNELTKALAYDRDQYSKGFSDGYEKALADVRLQLSQVVGILNDILNQNEEDGGAE